MRTSKKWGIALSVLFAIISLFYLMPIAVVLINSFKDNIAVNSNVFALPNQETFVGWSNYVNGLTSGAYPFLYSAQLYDHHPVGYPDPAVHLHGGVVHLPRG